MHVHPTQTEAAASSDPTDPHVREAQTFPRLDPDMIPRIASYGAEETIPDGGFVYHRGDRDADFFVVLDGVVETFAEGPNRERWVFACQRASQFHGRDQPSERTRVARFDSGLP